MNRFALSLLRVFKKPIPDVFRDEVMNPIGASDVEVGAVYERVCGYRRQAYGVGVGRHALGRRHVDQQLRHGAVRAVLAEKRQMGRQADCAACLREDGDDAERARTGLWLPVVAEHEAGAMAGLADAFSARGSGATSSSSRQATISSSCGAAHSRTKASGGSSRHYELIASVE